MGNGESDSNGAERAERKVSDGSLQTEAEGCYVKVLRLRVRLSREASPGEHRMHYQDSRESMGTRAKKNFGTRPCRIAIGANN
jgi:hypothetical protein